MNIELHLIKSLLHIYYKDSILLEKKFGIDK